jgi:hypothetical protein
MANNTMWKVAFEGKKFMALVVAPTFLEAVEEAKTAAMLNKISIEKILSVEYLAY